MEVSGPVFCSLARWIILNFSGVPVFFFFLFLIKEAKHRVYGKQQDDISFLPKHGQTWIN